MLVTNLFLSIANRISVKLILTLIIIVAAAFSIAIVINGYVSYKTLKLPENIILSPQENIVTETPNYFQIRDLFSEIQILPTLKKSLTQDTNRLSSVNNIEFIGSVITRNKKISFLKKRSDIFILEEGESIDGYTVKKIEKFRVILHKNGQNYVLYYKSSNTTSISKTTKFKHSVEKQEKRKAD